MPEPITKHAFVDDNPYIVYSGENETSASVIGVIPVLYRKGDYEHCNIEYATLKTSILNGKAIVAIYGVGYINEDGKIGWGGNVPSFCYSIYVYQDESEEYITFDIGDDTFYRYYPDGHIQYYD